MRILAIDPANKETAFVLMENYKPIYFKKIDNELFLEELDKMVNENPDLLVVIEMVASYGMPVGKDVFETCVFIGRIIEHCKKYEYIYRKEVKLNLCGKLGGANDTTVRHSLINRFAENDFRTGRGTKKNPDYFYGFKQDIWSAFAVGVTYLDKNKNNMQQELNKLGQVGATILAQHVINTLSKGEQ